MIATAPVACAHCTSGSTPTTSFSRRSTRALTWRTAAEVTANSSATAGAGWPSTATRQNICQWLSLNSLRTVTTACRYNATCAAVLAAAGKGIGADKLDLKEKTGLRQDALKWLQADLAVRARFLQKNPLLAIRIVDDLQHWQKDPDLGVVRDDKELGKLAVEERAAWQKFWTQVGALSKQARAAFSQTDHKGQLNDKEREQSHPLKMTAGKTYRIDMTSAEFDTYLRLEDDKGKVLAENDDISDENLNSRIIFSCKEDGNYRIVATSYQEAGRGAYVLTIRQFTSKR